MYLQTVLHQYKRAILKDRKIAFHEMSDMSVITDGHHPQITRDIDV